MAFPGAVYHSIVPQVTDQAVNDCFVKHVYLLLLSKKESIMYHRRLKNAIWLNVIIDSEQ